MNHADLLQRAEKWVSRQHYNKLTSEIVSSCGVILPEFKTYNPSIPDVIGFNSRRSIVIECKVSRADFQADRKKGHRHYIKQLGNYRYYMVLPHIVSVDDVPEGWGLIYVFAGSSRIVKYAPLHQEPEVKVVEYGLLYSIARRIALRGMLPDIRKPLKYFNQQSV